jgi:hypothetical protein
MIVRLRPCLAALIGSTLLPLAAQESSSAQPWYPDESLCKAMSDFAASVRTRPRVVRLSLSRDLPRSSSDCRDGGNRSGRELCRVLGTDAHQLATAVIAQHALACLGIGEPPTDPDDLVLHPFYVSGKFESEPPHFAAGKVRLTVELDASEESAVQWIAITASPIEGRACTDVRLHIFTAPVGTCAHPQCLADRQRARGPVGFPPLGAPATQLRG